MDSLVGHPLDKPGEPDRWRFLDAEKAQVQYTIEDGTVPSPIACLSILLDLFVNYFTRPSRQSLASLRPLTDQAGGILQAIPMTNQTNTYNMNHHFVALAIVALSDALKHQELKDQARATLEDFINNLWTSKVIIGAGEAWASALKNFTTENIRQNSEDINGGSSSAPDRVGLQHLADAAVGKTEAAAGNGSQEGSRRGSYELRSPPLKGYLSVMSDFARSHSET